MCMYVTALLRHDAGANRGENLPITYMLRDLTNAAANEMAAQ